MIVARPEPPDSPETGETGASERTPHEIVGGHVGPIKMSLRTKLRAYFLAGILVTAPIAVTIYLAWALISFVDNRITPLIPVQYNPETYLPFSVPGLGLLILIVVLTLIGSMTAGLVGRMVIRTSETVLSRMPVIRSVYSAAKQIFETVLAHKSTAFREVALFEYPRRGCWAIGFITNYSQGPLEGHLDGDMVSIMLPTTPNPTSGYLLFLPKEDVIVLDMTVEDAMKLVISGGIVMPGNGKKVTVPPRQDAA